MVLSASIEQIGFVTRPCFGVAGVTGPVRSFISARPPSFAAAPLLTLAPAVAPRPHTKPFVTISGARSLLDLNEDRILALVESGDILYAWNVALVPSRMARELRLLPAALSAFIHRVPCDLEWGDVLRLVVPQDEPTIHAKEITRILNLGVSQVYAFIRAKVLAPTCTHWRTGPGGGVGVTVQSFIQFLDDRRIT